MSKHGHHKPAEVLPYIQRYDNFNLAPRLSVLNVRYACRLIGAAWRDQQELAKWREASEGIKKHPA